MIICFILMVFIALLLFKKNLLQNHWFKVSIIVLFVIQQAFILSNDYYNNVKRYESTKQAIQDSDYHSPALAKKINAAR